ncbi:hypothetical protein BZG36_04738 [Bifiguratus adelaidae]|uniref:Uncharacterized protein n=1 Tax=Bifiguratus adelaidae TaxID=1938954 RepID=A0A261XV44_9FUNG|nr:hypothetical protein BZG36_04738 [Bifiguratus adelaidae]
MERGLNPGAVAFTPGRQGKGNERGTPRKQRQEKRNAHGPVASATTSSLSSNQHAHTAPKRPDRSTPRSSVDGLFKPTRFITLTDPIDPVTVMPVSTLTPTTLAHQQTFTIVNTLDTYVDWVERSLKQFGQLTLIAMDGAMPDSVAIVNMVVGQEGSAGSRMDVRCDRVATFTSSSESSAVQSGLEFTLRVEGWKRVQAPKEKAKT